MDNINLENMETDELFQLLEILEGIDDTLKEDIINKEGSENE